MAKYGTVYGVQGPNTEIIELFTEQDGRWESLATIPLDDVSAVIKVLAEALQWQHTMTRDRLAGERER